MSEYVEYEKDKKYIDYWIREVLSSSDLLSGYSFSTEDLKQRAWLELLRASEKYDPAQGVKLMTYAKKAVERGIKEEAVFQINRAGLTGKEYVGPADSISIDDEENGIAQMLAEETMLSAGTDAGAEQDEETQAEPSLDVLRDGLGQITETERAVLYVAYGIDCERCTNAKKTAKQLGLTETEVKRALESGNRKLTKFLRTEINH